MIIQYIETALAHARYDVIDDEEPYYGEVPELPGVWATGKTLEECRRNLMEVIDGWIIVRLRRGLPIPPIDNCTIEELTAVESGVRAA
jgi:predicted RNase H-like HicB family nuclease